MSTTKPESIGPGSKASSRTTPSFAGLRPASPGRSRAARGASRKRDVAALPGRPDIVFLAAKVAIFVDGDYWHGCDLDQRLAKLSTGHNAAYWVKKIRTNVERDRRHDAALRLAGWVVIRLWETDVLRNPGEAVRRVEEALADPGST